MSAQPDDNLVLYGECLLATALMGCGAAALAWPFVGPRFSIGILMAALWSVLNLALLRQVARVLAHPDRTPAQKGRGTLPLLIVKFPVLYAVGYLILAHRWFPLASLLIGLSLWIIGFLGLAARRAMATACLVLSLAPCALGAEIHSATETDMPELPNLFSLLSHLFSHQPLGRLLHQWETIFFTWIILGCLITAAWAMTRRRDLVPSRLQHVAELFVDGFNEFVCGIVGPGGRRFTPFLGTLFLYIWFSNLIGLVPLFKSPTTGFRSIPGFPLPMVPITTIPLALAVFGYVQWTAIRHLGVLGYLDHLAGQPRNVFTIVVSPLMVVLHVLGEVFTKPLSLSFRLFGNIWSEDTVLAVLVGMGVAFLWVEFPLVWLALILSTVQAVVFTLLSTIYIAMVLPQEEDPHNEKGEVAHG